MRILYIAGQDMLARSRGSEVVCWHVARGLARSNELYALNLQVGDFPLERGGAPDFRVTSFRLFSRMQKVFHWPLFREAWSALRREPYDFIFCDYVWAGAYGALLSRLTGVPYVFHDHDVEHVIKRQTDSALEYLCGSVVEWYCCRTASLVITVSEDDLAQLSKWIRHYGFASRLGVDTGVMHPHYTPDPGDTPVVLFFGDLNYQPNVQAVEEIYERIAPSVAALLPDVRFIIAGRGGSFHFAHPNVERVGFVPDIAAVIKGADVVIVPLKVGGGMRMKIIESLACGKPVISTPAGAAGISDAFENLTLCPIETFPGTIARVLESCSPVSGADFDLIQRKYSWTAIVDRILVEVSTVLGL